MSEDSSTARVDARTRGLDLALERAEEELPAERDIMADLHREAEEFQKRLLRQFPEPYVRKLLDEEIGYQEGVRSR
ncbi:MAG: hypothetical protein SVS85_02035 [Candidatus Nanohaloarchaea archaeon]|nr:hypothetical protein [Candidatus Nanohaloarchaea archaeon]